MSHGSKAGTIGMRPLANSKGLEVKVVGRHLFPMLIRQFRFAPFEGQNRLGKFLGSTHTSPRTILRISRRHFGLYFAHAVTISCTSSTVPTSVPLLPQLNNLHRSLAVFLSRLGSSHRNGLDSRPIRCFTGPLHFTPISSRLDQSESLERVGEADQSAQVRFSGVGIPPAGSRPVNTR